MGPQITKSNEVELYLGVDPDYVDEDILPSFTSKNFIPLGWFFFFRPDDLKTREQFSPDSLQNLVTGSSFVEIGIDNIEEHLKQTVAMKTTLPEAKSRLVEFKEAFRDIPYIWSYFRIVEILDMQIEKIITELEVNLTVTPVKRANPHPESPRSQVKTKPSDSDAPEAIPSPPEDDNPFASLENFGLSTKEELSETSDLLGFDDDLLSALASATELDQLHVDFETEVSEAQIEEDRRDSNYLPVIVKFENIATNNRGKRYSKIPIILDRLLHHAKREEKMTRIMQDYLQDIFRELDIDWRITGLLAEDFIQSDPSILSEIMIGVPSPFIIIRETFDLEYWSQNVLQVGDERLMYRLTMLPTEEIHRALQTGKLEEVVERVGEIMIKTQAHKLSHLNIDKLKKPPIESNLWGFRVLIQDTNRNQKAATILCENPSISWEKDFNKKINLPGVLIDWNIEYLARFNDFNDSENYRVVLRKAKDTQASFFGFIRWVRRHNLIYNQQYGVKGTINALKDELVKTEDKSLGMLIFDTLTKLTELGIDEAMDVLSQDVIVRKLPWLYS